MPDRMVAMNANTTARPRTATTLVEVLGTLSVLLVLGVSAASILGSITQVGVTSHKAMQGRASVERLAKVFRRDVQQSSEITAATEPLTIDLTVESMTVRYRWHEDSRSITREVSEGEQQLSTDRFTFPQELRPDVSISESLAVLRLSEGPVAKQTGRRWVIEASRS